MSHHQVVKITVAGALGALGRRVAPVGLFQSDHGSAMFLRPLKQIKALKRKCQEELHAMMKCQEVPIGRNGWEMHGK